MQQRRRRRRNRRHYVFAHRLLPLLFLKDPMKFAGALENQGNALIRRFWRHSGPWWGRLWPGRCPSWEEIDLGWGAQAILLTMPPPKEMTEAYFVALVRHPWRAGGRPLAMVYTLEHGIEFPSFTPRTVLCGWYKGPGKLNSPTHFNCGTGPKPDAHVFLEWVRERFQAVEPAGARVPVTCSGCGVSSMLEAPEKDLLDALFDNMRVVGLRRELELVQRTENLFNRFPESKHPEKMRHIDRKAETAPDPEFDAALAEDPELGEFLSKSTFYLTGQVELLRGSIEESAASVDVALITCKGCGSGVLLLDERFYDAHR